MKKTLSYFKKRKALTYTISGVVVLVLVLVFAFNNSSSSVETAMSEVGSVVEKIGVTGKVIALKKAELGFEKGGVVSKINYKVGDKVKVGDIVITLDPADVSAQLQGAQASLLAEKANLTDLVNGLRPEELSVEEAKLKSAQTSFEDGRTTITNALHDSYVKAENSIFNYSDSLFTNPQTVVPRINIRTENYSQESGINNGRVVAGEKLRQWKANLDGMKLSDDPVVYLDKVHGYIESIKVFMSQLSTIVSNLTTGNSGLSQTTIDSYNATVNTALSTFNTAVGSLASAEATYRSASSNLALIQDQYNLNKAGSSEQVIQAQQARTDQASANVFLYQTELSRRRLVSPIDGVVTKIQPEVGEFVSIGQTAVVIMSDVLKVEVNIPESDIAKVAVGNTASITLDAYDSSIVFSAHVSAIDPAETIVEGVPTYKVTLQFDKSDERIRSGMTANIDIITSSKDDVVTVPFMAVIDKKGEKYIRVVDNSSSNGYVEVKVTTGIKSNDGKIEIIDGLEAGAEVITLIK